MVSQNQKSWKSRVFLSNVNGSLEVAIVNLKLIEWQQKKQFLIISQNSLQNFSVGAFFQLTSRCID